MIDISVLTSEIFSEYFLLDSGEGERLEKFGSYVIRRPDPQCLWQRSLSDSEWKNADVVFVKQESGDKGSWKLRTNIPSRWQMHWHDVTFYAELTPFKHVGVFPEQAIHWQWMKDLLEKSKGARDRVKVLNLFAYTGVASVVCAKAGAFVTHVDASKPSIGWAQENMLASGLAENTIRWILDDVMDFVQREVRRGNTYDAIIMDPPVFGHGAHGEVWKFQEHFPMLLHACRSLLSQKPLFMIVNAYAVSASSIMLQNMLEDILFDTFSTVSSGELVISQQNGRLLSTGIFGRISSGF